MKFNSEISLSHILLALTFIVTALSWKASVENTIAKGAYAREAIEIKMAAADAELAFQLRQTTEILKEMQMDIKLNTAHRIVYENGDKAGHK